MRDRTHIHLPVHFGEVVADRVVAVLGSWRFIIIQSVFLAFWLMLNVIVFMQHWDPYPFILLNLALSFEAAYASPLILMSQNRQASRDKARDDLEAKEVQGLYDSHELLMKINQQQLEMLNKQSEMLTIMRGQNGNV